MGSLQGVHSGLLAALLLAGCSHAPPPIAAGRAAGAAPGLAGTSWRLVEFQSMDDTQGRRAPTDPGRYTIAFGPDGRAALLLDCNRGSGTWQATQSGSGGSLTFGPIAATRMACPEPSLAPLLERQLPYVRSYTLSGGRLNMSLMADGGIFTWEPRR